MNDSDSGLSQDEALELQKVRIRQEMQEEITSWAKKRFATLGIIVAVLGFFGLSTVLHQSLQILVTKPVDRELVKLDTAKERANEVTARLRVLTQDVEEKGRQAQRAAADASIKIKELEANIEDSRKAAAEIQTKYNYISGGMSRVSNDIFELASEISEEERRLKAEIRKASRTLTALGKLSTSIAEAFPTSDVDDALDQFRSDVNTINYEHIDELNRINEIRSFNIVYYVDGADEDATAHAVVRALKSEGYRAAVWYAQGGDRRHVIEEISSEFGDIADVLETSVKGIVIHPEHEDVASEIEQLLSTKFKLNDMPSVARSLHPADIHLSYDQGRKSFDADKIILIYSLAPGGT